MALDTTNNVALPLGLTAKKAPVNHPNTVDSSALMPRKMAESEADTFERNPSASGIKPVNVQPKTAGRGWVLPVLGSLSGIGLAIGTYFLGRNQGAETASKEAHELFQKATGLAGKTETELKTALQTKVNEAVANASTGASVISTQLREQLITLTKQQADVTDEALLQAVLNHSTTTAKALKDKNDLLQEQRTTLADALVAVGVPFTDVEGRDKPFNELVTLAQGKITQTSEENAGLQEAIQTAYTQLHPDRKQTEVTQQLEALKQVGQRTAEQEKHYKETLKNTLIQLEVDPDSVKDLSTQALETELKIKITDKLAALKTAQQECDDSTTALTAVQKQLRQVLAAHVNTVGEKLVSQYLEGLTNKSTLEPFIKAHLSDFGATGGLTMEDVQRVLKQGFTKDVHTIAGINREYSEFQPGFEWSTTLNSVVPTKHTKVTRLFVNILEDFNSTKQLSSQERTLVQEYLETLLKHPDATERYTEKALHIYDDNFLVNTAMLGKVAEIVTKNPMDGASQLVNTLLTHPRMEGLFQNKNSPVRQALKGVMPTLIKELKEKPQTFHAAGSLNSMEVILSRAIKLATKEQLLENLANYQPFFVESEQITKGAGREALFTHLMKQVLKPNSALDELTGSPAKKLTDTSISSVLAHLSGGTSDDDYNLFSHRLIKDFAEQFFPEVLAEFEVKHEGTRLFNAETPNILELLNKKIASLDEKKPHELKLKGAIEALNDIYQESAAMETWYTQGGEVPPALKIPDGYVRTGGAVVQQRIQANESPKRPRSLYSSNQTNAT